MASVGAPSLCSLLAGILGLVLRYLRAKYVLNGSTRVTRCYKGMKSATVQRSRWKFLKAVLE